MLRLKFSAKVPHFAKPAPLAVIVKRQTRNKEWRTIIRRLGIKRDASKWRHKKAYRKLQHKSFTQTKMTGTNFFERDLKEIQEHTKLCLTVLWKKESMTVTMTFFNGQQKQVKLNHVKKNKIRTLQTDPENFKRQRKSTKKRKERCRKRTELLISRKMLNYNLNKAWIFRYWFIIWSKDFWCFKYSLEGFTKNPTLF